MENSIRSPSPRRNFRRGRGHAHRRPLLEYRYDVPFKFTGTISKLTFNLEPEPQKAEERKQNPAREDAVARAKD